MPTRTEAAEALYRAAITAAPKITDDWASSETRRAISRHLTEAADAYSTSTPDPLPAEVQRVVEAADRYVEKWGKHPVDNDDAWAELVSAVVARRSTQPEPLSARLARLKPGSVVEDDEGDAIAVLAVDEPTRRLFGAWTGKHSKERCTALFHFDRIVSILSESP